MMGFSGATIPQHIIDRVVGRRGTAHIHAAFDPRRTALVVIDLQNGYMHPDGGYSEVKSAPAIVPRVNAIAAALRAAGGVVAWVQNTDDASCRTDWSVHDDMLLPEITQRRIGAMTEGSFGHALWATLDPQPEDIRVKKYRYSAFMPGTCDLPEMLRARGIDTVLITGTMTNVCCESSARDAMMTNFKVIMVTDGNAAHSQADHDAAVSIVYRTFGDAQDTAMVLARLQQETIGASA
jgi:ureidoacrylate peracid hydrolase